MAYTYYQAPPATSGEDMVMGWVREAVQQGQNFLGTQRGYQDLRKCFDIIAGVDGEKLPSYLSKIKSNRLKRQAREIVATLSDIRNFWDYQTDNRDFYQNKNVLTRSARAWWQNSFADRGMREALQYAVVGGTGWVSPTWNHDFYGYGRGELVLDSFGPDDVLVVQLPKSGDHQQAYAVIIRKEMPIALAHAFYPEYSHLIVPDRDAPSMMKRAVEQMQRFMSPVLNAFGKGSRREPSSVQFPTVDIFHTYIMDRTINMSGYRKPMGKVGSSWYYEVPSFGDLIASGNGTTRKADRVDAMLYPMRRLIVGTRNVRISDDTSPWWHGMVPAIPFRTDDWPWEFLGMPVIKDGVEYDNSLTELMRGVNNVARVRLQPPLQYDTNAVAKSDMEKLDTRKPNTKIGVNMQMGEAIKMLLPHEVLEVPAWIGEFAQLLKDDMDYQIGAKDMMALAKARSMQAGDMKQIEEFAGPIVKDISRGMEKSLRELGTMMKFNFFQYYNLARRVQLLGSDGITREDFDYSPGDMVPSHMPGEDLSVPSKFDKFSRARNHANNFYYYATPGALHEITQMTQKLMLLQLQRTGFPLDPWTMADAFNVPNFGPPPKGTSNVMERFVAWMRMKNEWAVEQQKTLAKAQLEIQAAAQAAQAGSIAAGAVAGAQAGGGGAPADPSIAEGNGAVDNSAPGGPPAQSQGRPPTAQKAPHIVSKDGGTRSTIAES